MGRSWLTALIPLLITACAAPLPATVVAPRPAVLQAQSARQNAPLFRVQENFEWRYDVTISPVMDPYVEDKGTWTLRTDRITQNGGRTVLELRAIDNFRPEYVFPTLIQDAQGVTLKDMTFLGMGSDKVAGLQIPLVKMPLQAGARWEDENWIGKVKGLEKITVPAGTYDAWRIEVIGTWDSAYTAVGDYWFVPNLGMVKSRMTIPNWHVDTQLTHTGVAR